MGGFCSVRMSCGRFHADGWGMVADHLCTPKTHDAWRPISINASSSQASLDDSNNELTEEGNWQ